MSFGFSIGDFLGFLKLAKSIRAKWIDAPLEYATLRDEIQNIENVLRNIDELKNEVELIPREIEDLRSASSSCQPVLETCNKIVDKYAAITIPVKSSWDRVRRAWKRFKLDPDNIRHARDQLSALVTQVAAIAGAIRTRMINDIQEGIKDLKQSEDQRERKQIANWYAPASFAIQQDEYSKARQSGTGTWFLQDDRYIHWRDKSPNSTLLCAGIPGSGKTMMAAAVVDDLHQLLESENGCVVAYFYCNFNRREQQELHHIYSSLVRQLFQEQSVIPAKVRALYSKHSNRQTRPSIDELKTLLRFLAQQHRKVYVIVDALDECNTNNRTRDELIHELSNVQKTSGNTCLLVTTRFIPEIVQNFTACQQLEVRAVREDIERYLNNRMRELAPFVRDRVDLQEEIKSQIVALVDGMFLLARLHFEALIGYTNALKLREALKNLPSGKDALRRAYDTARERIEHQPKPQANLARHVLTWVAYAKRELFIKEVQEAVAMSMTPGKVDINHEDDLDEPDEILSVCAGLVVLDRKTGIIRLVHYTTQDYINDVQEHWLPHAQVDILQSCLAYLNLNAFRLDDTGWHHQVIFYFERYKLLSYVGSHWGDHAREIGSNGAVDQIVELLCNEKKLCFASLVTLQCAEQTHYIWHGTLNVTPLHMCAFFDMAVVYRLLIAGAANIDLRDSNDRTPLIWAATRNSTSILQLMLEQQDNDINAMDNLGITACRMAVQYNRKQAFELLLSDPKMDINTADSGGMTPLMAAVSFNHIDMVDILVHHPKIAVNKKDRDRQTALMMAVKSNRKEMIDMLLHHRSTIINVTNKDTNTTLCHPALKGYKDVVGLLLGHPDIDVNEPDRDGCTALMLAVEYNRREVVELLLGRSDIHVNARATDTTTAIIKATKRGYKELVRLLLSHADIDVNAKTTYGTTALIEAAIIGWKEIVRLLLSHSKIDVNVTTEYGDTALTLAVLKRYKEIVELLLYHPKIDVTVKNRFCSTAQSIAKERGFEEIATLLEAHFLNATKQSDPR